MKFTKIYGIDVASAKLDIFDAQSGKLIEIENTYDAVGKFAKLVGVAPMAKQSG